MSDPQNLGLGELGQRVQAMGEPAPEPRLRPYQGAPLPIGTGSNGRPIPAYEPHHDTHEDTHAVPATTYASPYTPLHPEPYKPEPFKNEPFADPFGLPAAPEPYIPLGNGKPPATPKPEPPSEYTSESNAAPAPESASPAASSPATTAAAPVAADDPNAPKSGLQRAVAAVRTALPLVQRLLPLLDGNFASVIGALMAPQPGHHPPPAPVKVDLEPVERGLAEVRTSHRELRTQVQEQSVSLKRVEDQLDRVREATDRNTLEQQELIEDLRSVGGRMSAFAIIGLVLLLVSLGINVYFLVQLQHILR